MVVPESITDREVLRHNPRNAVTASVERITDGDGGTVIRKELRGPAGQAPVDNVWAASTDPRHWNYWRREADAYGEAHVRTGLEEAGLGLPAAEIEEQADGVVLWLEDVTGRPGTLFDVDDHAALSAAHGRWQARGRFDTHWASHRFLRTYSTSQQTPYELLEDDAAWAQPLVRDCWPAGLRSGWRRMLANQEELLRLMERLPRARSHLDLWVCNLIRRTDGVPVLLDWAFAGDGAIGEDIGNYVPDAVLDLFWPAERIGELDELCFTNYLSGLREAGWEGSERDVRLGMVASAVKYVWLLPLMLGKASDTEHAAYHRSADGERLFQQRGMVFAHLVSWCDEALTGNS